MLSKNTSEMGWVEAVGGFGLALVDGGLVCRDPGGKLLSEIPDKVRRTDVARRLLDLSRWLAQHRRRCLGSVETWMLRATPVSVGTVASVWPDPAWQRAFRGAIVSAWPHTHGEDCLAVIAPGEDGRSLQTRDREGRPVTLDAASIQILHPALIEGSDDFMGMGLDQGLEQLAREVHEKTEAFRDGQSTLERFAGTRFERLSSAHDLSRALGCVVRGGYVACAATDGALTLEARLWVGFGGPSAGACTGELFWADPSGAAVPLADVGPVAWSEGLRMAHRIRAGALLR